MDIQYLRDFLLLAETENYTDASNILCESPSSLFRRIKQIEKELGVVLFNKKGKNIELNEFGKLLLPYAEKITKLDTACKQKIMSRLSVTEQRVKIYSNYHILDLAVRFHREHEEYVLDIQRGTCVPKEVEKLVGEHAFDMYFLTNIKAVEKTLTCVSVIREKLMILAPKDHPIAQKSVVNVEELKDQEFILFHDLGTKEGAYNPHNALFRNIDFIPKSSIRVNRSHEVIKLVQKGFGLAVLSKRILEEKNHEDVSIIPIEPAKEYTVWCCYPKEQDLPCGAQLFLDFIREEGMEEDWGLPFQNEGETQE